MRDYNLDKDVYFAKGSQTLLTDYKDFCPNACGNKDVSCWKCVSGSEFSLLK